MDAGIITTLHNSFAFVLTSGFGRVFPVALSLLGKLAVLELILVATWAWWSDDNVVAALLVKLMWIMAFVFLVTQWPKLCRILMTSFITAGLRAGGGPLTVDDMTNPSNLARFGLEVTAVLWQRLAGKSGLQAVMSLPMLFVDGWVAIGIVLAYFVMAIQVFVCHIEFYIVAVLAMVLVPFGVFRHTSFLGEKGIGVVIAFGIKMMVLAAILNSSDGVLQTVRMKAATGLLDINETLSLLMASWALALLAWHAPSVAAGMIAGAPSLTAATVAHGAVAAVAGVGLAGIAGVGAKNLLGAATRTGLRLGAAGTAAYQAGGVRGVLQTAQETAAYHAEMVTAGFRGAYASGRVYGANFEAVPFSPGSPANRAASTALVVRNLATRIVPPPSPPQGGMSGPIRHP
jgi:type IV secretion system protein TrbL